MELHTWSVSVRLRSGRVYPKECCNEARIVPLMKGDLLEVQGLTTTKDALNETVQGMTLKLIDTTNPLLLSKYKGKNKKITTLWARLGDINRVEFEPWL
jgi:hypothetical protein